MQDEDAILNIVQNIELQKLLYETKTKGAMSMSFDYSKLKGRIVEKCGTSGKFAELMGLSERTMSLKLNNKVVFRQNEIVKAVDILSLSDDEITRYFFTPKVQYV